MAALRQNLKTRERIALLVVCGWLGVFAVGALAVIFGLLQIDDLKDLGSMWHQYVSPAAIFVIGYYFGSPNMSGDSQEHDPTP